MAERGCPSSDELAAFVLGKLPEARLGDLAVHLDRCPACEAAVESLERLSDDVITGLRRPDSPQAPRDRPPDHEPPSLLGDYRILRELGRGGMGIVYEAEQVSLGRRVAVKILPRQYLPGAHAVDRFRRESRAAARLHHTNIVQVYGTGEQDGLHYFVMQKIAGAGLDHVVGALRRLHHSRSSAGAAIMATPDDEDMVSLTAIAERLVGGRTGASVTAQAPTASAGSKAAIGNRAYWTSVATIGLQIAEALAFAHAQGVLHRDVKPSNLLIDREGQAWLADFGLAKEAAERDDFTASGFLIGTLRYIPPERLEGRSDALGDVYGLGISLYELLTLNPAFTEPDRSKLLHQILHDEPPRPRRHNLSIPRDLETIVLKAVARDPRHRYQSAALLAQDLRLFLEDKPIRARRVREVERLWRWARRNPVPALLASAFILTLTLGSAGVVWKWRESERYRRQAEAEKSRAILAERQTADERDTAERVRDDSRRVLAGVMLDQGSALAEQGDVGEGLFWMLEGLRVSPDLTSELARVIRSNLAGWLDQSYGLRALIEQPAPIEQCEFSPDNQRFVTVSKGVAQCWDAATGRPLAWSETALGPVAYSPDGKVLVTCKKGLNQVEWQVQGRDAISGRPIGAPLPHPKFISAVAFSPDGRLIATGSHDGLVRFWEPASGNQARAPIQVRQAAITGLVFSPDGTLLGVVSASGHAENGVGAVDLWNMSSGKSRAVPLVHNGTVSRLAFCPDVLRFLTVNADGAAQLWDLAACKPAGPALLHPSGGIAARFSPDGRTVVTGSADGVARFWDAASGDPLVGTLPRHRGQLRDLAFSPDGNTIVAVGGPDESGTICVWQTPRSLSRPASKERRIFARSNWALNDTLPWYGRQFVTFSPDATAVLSGGKNGSARLLSAANARPLCAPLRNDFDRVYITAYSPDGRLVATASQDVSAIGDARLWNAATGQPVGAPLPHLNWVSAMTFSPDSQVLVTGGYDNAVHFWKTTTGQRKGAALPLGVAVQRVAYSSDGNTLAIAYGGTERQANGVILWDVQNGRRIGSPIEGKGTLFQFSPVGHLLVTASSAMLRLWDATTGREVRPPMLGAADVNALAFSPDGILILTGSTDGTVRVWDTVSGQAVGAPFLHPHGVNAVAFSPDATGRLILVACGDGSSQLWDRATQKRLGPPAFQSRAIVAACFSQDGHSYLTATDEGRARVWPVPSPVTGELDSLALCLQVRTGREMGAGQTVLQLDPQEWEERRRRLASLEGSVESAYAGSVNETAFHDARARDAESHDARFAARWHLSRLIAARDAESKPPSSADAWLLPARRARSFASEDLLDQALADDRRAVSLGSRENLLRWYKLAIVDCLERKEWPGARWSIDRALAVAPDDGALHADQVWLDQKLGDLARGEADLERVMDHPGVDPVVLYRLADEFARGQRWHAAAKLYSRAVERGLAPYVSWDHQAIVFLKAGDRPGYQKLCAALVAGAIEPPHPQVVNAAAWTCALAPDALPNYTPLFAMLEKAANQANSAARPAILSTMGAVLYRAGRYQESVARMEEAIRAAARPERFEDWVFLAMAHHRLGDATRAKTFLARLMKASLDDERDPWQKRERELLGLEARALIESPSASAHALTH